MTRTEEANALFSNGNNCAQAVFAVFRDKTNIDRESSFRIAYALGGGMGRTNSVCGAFSGALLVIGALTKTSIPDNEEKERIYALTGNFSEKFMQKYKSNICGDILGLDISVKEQREKAKETGLFENICPEAVRTAVGILEELI